MPCVLAASCLMCLLSVLVCYPLLSCVLAVQHVGCRSVRWVFADVVPDYLCGPNTAVLFLSLR